MDLLGLLLEFVPHVVEQPVVVFMFGAHDDIAGVDVDREQGGGLLVIALLCPGYILVFRRFRKVDQCIGMLPEPRPGRDPIGHRGAVKGIFFLQGCRPQQPGG